jgi:hypothetical protein
MQHQNKTIEEDRFENKDTFENTPDIDKGRTPYKIETEPFEDEVQEEEEEQEEEPTAKEPTVQKSNTEIDPVKYTEGDDPFDQADQVGLPSPLIDSGPRDEPTPNARDGFQDSTPKEQEVLDEVKPVPVKIIPEPESAKNIAEGMSVGGFKNFKAPEDTPGMANEREEFDNFGSEGQDEFDGFGDGAKEDSF